MKEIREDGITVKQKKQKRGYCMEGRLEADMEILFAQSFCLSQDAYIRDSIVYTGAFYSIQYSKQKNACISEFRHFIFRLILI